jgi:hypothetical protein
VAFQFLEQLYGADEGNLSKFGFLGYGSLNNIKTKSVKALMGPDGLANQSGNAYFQSADFVAAAKMMDVSDALITKVQTVGQTLNLTETLQISSAMLRDGSSSNEVNWEKDFLGRNGFIAKLESFGFNANIAHSGLQFVKETMSHEGGHEFTLESTEWSSFDANTLTNQLKSFGWDDLNNPANINSLDVLAQTRNTNAKNVRQHESPDAMNGLRAMSQRSDTTDKTKVNGLSAATIDQSQLAKVMATGSALSASSDSLSGLNAITADEIKGELNTAAWQSRDGWNGPSFATRFYKDQVDLSGGNVKVNLKGDRGGEAVMQQKLSTGIFNFTIDPQFNFPPGNLVTAFIYSQATDNPEVSRQQSLEGDIEFNMLTDEMLPPHLKGKQTVTFGNWVDGVKYDQVTLEARTGPQDFQFVIDVGYMAIKMRTAEGWVTATETYNEGITMGRINGLQAMLNTWRADFASGRAEEPSSISLNAANFEKKPAGFSR